MFTATLVVHTSIVHLNGKHCANKFLNVTTMNANGAKQKDA